jgi:CO/xanthine dehydrogenase Mo-binding subunit
VQGIGGAIMGIAPTIPNAILDATGKALTTLPLFRNDVLS